jgi:hypothetical protein
MKPLYYILPLLLLVLASCTPKGVNFFGVPIEGTLDEFLTAIDGTNHIALDSANIEYFKGAYGTCTFMGMPMEFYLAAKPITIDSLPSSRVQTLTLVGSDTIPIEVFTAHYGKEYEVNSEITYWSFENGEVGFGWKFNQIYLHFYRK